MWSSNNSSMFIIYSERKWVWSLIVSSRKATQIVVLEHEASSVLLLNFKKKHFSSLLERVYFKSFNRCHNPNTASKSLFFILSLTYFWAISPFYTSWKHQFGFQVFSGGYMMGKLTRNGLIEKVSSNANYQLYNSWHNDMINSL